MNGFIQFSHSLGIDPMQAAIAIVVIAIVLVAGFLDMIRDDRPRVFRSCACFEYPGDNSNCPIAEHRHLYRALENEHRKPARPGLGITRLFRPRETRLGTRLDQWGRR